MKFCKFILCAAFGLTIFFIASDVKSQTKQAENNDVRKWEYCVIHGNANSQTKDNKMKGLVTISYLDENGGRDETIEAVSPDTSLFYSLVIRKAINKAFSKLGNEGWEFVGNFPYAPNEINENMPGFFFKRQKK